MKVDKSQWITRPICELFNLQMGKTPSRKELHLWEGGDVPWVSISDMNSKNIYETKEMLPMSTIKSCNVPIVPSNTVIMSFKLTIGKTCITKCPMTTNEAIMAFYPREGTEISIPYLSYALSSLKWEGNRAVKGLTINKKTIAQRLFSLPPLHEQKGIAAELDALQELIDGYKAQLNDLDELIKSIFNKNFGDIHSNPYNFDIKLMQDVCSKITDGTHNPPKFVDSGIPFIFVSNIANYEISYLTKKHIDDASYNELWKSTPVEVGDVVYTSVGSYGNPAIVRTDKKFMFQRHIALLKPKHDIIDSEYLKWFLISPSGREQADNKAIGAAQKTLNLKAIKTFKVLVPPKEKQQCFTAQVKVLEKQRALLQEQLADAEQLMAERMQYYFS